MKNGQRVKLSEQLKQKLINNGSQDVEEFGKEIGTVTELVDYGSGVHGPEVNVVWIIDGVKLRYAYHPDDLIKV